MQFALFTVHDRALSEDRLLWQTVEAEGFDALGIIDSPLLMREAFVSLSAAAFDTTTIRLFPCVLNTLTRDPTVVAGGWLALDDLALGRVFLAFGSGDSSTHGIGLGAARLAHMEEYISAVRALVSGDQATYQGRRLHGARAHAQRPQPKIIMSAHGPRALEIAGSVADGVISGFGLLPETIEFATQAVRRGAERAGRDPESVEIWHFVYFAPAETIEEGFLHANGCGAAVLSRRGLQDKLVPPHLVEGCARSARRGHLRHTDVPTMPPSRRRVGRVAWSTSSRVAVTSSVRVTMSPRSVRWSNGERPTCCSSPLGRTSSVWYGSSALRSARYARAQTLVGEHHEWRTIE